MLSRPLAVVTGASSGIGLELARIAAHEGHDLVICADEPEIRTAADSLRAAGAAAEAVEADLATAAGVDRLIQVIADRPVAALLANAGKGFGGAFLDQEFDKVRLVIDTNVTGTLYLLQRLVPGMIRRGQGRVLITGSIAGFVPGAYNAVYNATKAFVDVFSFALREEVKDSGITITCLMPGATDTGFFERAGMEDTALGKGPKDDPAKVARAGWDAMMRGDGGEISGWANKLQAAAAHVTPAAWLARAHAKAAKPGSGD